jgi:hypothetical protein
VNYRSQRFERHYLLALKRPMISTNVTSQTTNLLMLVSQTAIAVGLLFPKYNGKLIGNSESIDALMITEYRSLKFLGVA